MKNLITLILIACSSVVHAQFFQITPTGFISKIDPTKDYYVVNHSKLNQQELYKKSLIYFNGQFSSPKNVISTVENESITLNFYDKYNIIMSSIWNVNMSYTFNFKDGKVKISAPYIVRIFNDNLNTISINKTNEGSNFPIYKRNDSGELRGSDGLKAKTIIEQKTNAFVLQFINHIITDTPKKDDW